MPPPESYDQLLYGDLTFHDSHPASLHAAASLLGLTPPPPESARVLELGCGTGFNLIAMALSLPGAHFTGVDLNAAQIDRARHVAATTGAANVEFHAISLADFPAPPASFDYVIAHGLYSWIPAPIRDALLALTSRCLSPHGIAYVSYNTYPGWRLRTLLRDAFDFVLDPAQPLVPQLPAARASLDLLTQSLLQPDSHYAHSLRDEWSAIRTEPDYYVAHEYCADENYALYFAEFTRHAAANHLQFVAEAYLFANSFAQNSDTLAALDQFAPADRLRRESTLDWLVGRTFRQSILTHAALPLLSDPALEPILSWYLVPCVDIVEQLPDALRVRRRDGKEVEISSPAAIEVLLLLHQFSEPAAPANSFESAVLTAIDLNGLEDQTASLFLTALWNGWRAGIWTFRATLPHFAPAVSATPTACPLARLQAANGADATNRFHRPVRLSPAERALLSLCDGSRTLAALAAQSNQSEEETAAALKSFAARALLSA